MNYFYTPFVCIFHFNTHPQIILTECRLVLFAQASIHTQKQWSTGGVTQKRTHRRLAPHPHSIVTNCVLSTLASPVCANMWLAFIAFAFLWPMYYHRIYLGGGYIDHSSPTLIASIVNPFSVLSPITTIVNTYCIGTYTCAYCHPPKQTFESALLKQSVQKLWTAGVNGQNAHHDHHRREKLHGRTL